MLLKLSPDINGISQTSLLQNLSISASSPSIPTKLKYPSFLTCLLYSFSLIASYALPSVGGYDITAFAHVFNATDATYVKDAVDHSQYNSYGDKVQAAHNAEVFLGTPRYFNVGVAVSF